MEMDAMKRLSGLAAEQVRLEAEVADAEARLKQVKDRLRDVSENQIPELMESLGFEKFKTTDGFSVAVRDVLRHSIPKAKKSEAYAWLEENGYGGVIKRTVVVPFLVHEGARAEELREILRRQGYDAAASDKVEPSTLGSLLTELLERGAEVPMDLFGAFRQRFAKVTR